MNNLVDEVFIHNEPSQLPVAASTALHDRRRPGRADDVSPNLIAILRGIPSPETAVPGAPADSLVEVLHDDLDAARGIGVAIAWAILFWCLVFWAW